MPRPSRLSDTEERLGVGSRLDALQLRSVGGGWVPEPLDPTASDPVLVDQRLLDLPSQPSQPSQPPPPVDRPSAESLARAWVADRLPPWTHDLIERIKLGSVLVGLGFVIVAVILGLMVAQHHANSGYSPYPATGEPTAAAADPVPAETTASSADSASIVVDVGGRVRKPGLVTLPQGARVADALAAAGGPLHHRDIATLDLAARVSDGQLLLVGEPGAASGSGAPSDASGASTAGPVDLSSATVDQLETLPGVGPATAQKIVDWRTAHNGFTTVSQLQQVSGIGPAKYAEISPLVTP